MGRYTLHEIQLNEDYESKFSERYNKYVVI
jgi:hypothetical protein